MKLLSFVNPKSGVKTWGCIEGEMIYDLGKRLSAYYPDLKSVIAAKAVDELSRVKPEQADFHASEIRFLPVIENPNKIFCVGMNYMEKRIEFEQTIDAPTLFVRFPDTLSAHGEVVCKPDSSNEFD